MFLASASIVSLTSGEARARPDVFSLFVSMDLASVRRYKDKARATNAYPLITHTVCQLFVRKGGRLGERKRKSQKCWKCVWKERKRQRERERKRGSERERERGGE